MRGTAWRYLLLTAGLTVCGACDGSSSTKPPVERPRVQTVPDDHDTIQGAVDATQEGDTVRIRAGTYTGDGNTRIRIQHTTLVVEGAGAGKTIIDCRQAGAQDPGSVFEVRSPGSGSMIKGLSVRNARAGDAEGGGLSCTSGWLRVEDCAFENCAASKGGGMYFLNATVELHGVSCQGCVAEAGGGIHVQQSTLYGNVVRLMDNHAVDGGGLLVNRSVCIVSGSTVLAGNVAEQDGGGMSMWEGYVSIIGGLLAQNVGGSEGGAVSVWGEGSVHLGSVTITDNAAGPDGGGGVRVHTGGTVAFSKVILRGNCAGTAGGDLHVDSYAVARFFCCGMDTTQIVIDQGGSVDRTGAQVFSDPKLCGSVGCGIRGPLSYGLEEDSPCLDFLNPCGLGIGALGRCSE
jgi:hypothetical protein